MMIKKILIAVICVALALGCIGCRKLDGDGSSILSNTSNTSDISQLESATQDTSNTIDTNSSNTSSTTQSTPSTPSQQESIDLEEKYGFSSLVSVEYKCLKDIPSGDAQYEITAIRTNKGSSISYMGQLLCDDKEITIDNLIVTIPYEYRQKHNSVTLTAKHRQADVSCNFTINFDKWELIFEDNFDGTELNTSVWNVWDEKPDWLYSYSKDNLFLDGKGNLVNRMSVLEDGTRLSGAMTTQGTFETTYGYFEVRLKPHFSPGLMGAFWLMCGDMGDKNALDDNTAVNGCEIDIIETFFHNKNPAQTIHWDGYTYTKSKHFSFPNTDRIFDGNYHTFALFWTPEEYIFLIDGEVSGTTDVMGICTQPGYLLISSHFNNKAGEITFGKGEHTDMLVDYVKVFTTPSYK